MDNNLKLIEIKIKSEYNFKDISPYCFGEHVCGKSHAYGPVTRPHWMLCYIVSGYGKLWIDDKEYALSGGQCFVLKPYTRSSHRADADQPWHYIWIEFTTSLIMPELLLNNYVIDAKRIAHVFTSMCKVVDLHCDRGIWFCQKIYEIISLILESETVAASNAKYYVDCAIAIIESGYYTDINVSSLAARLNINRSYFSCIFKDFTGETPIKYITNYRLSRAGDLLTLYRYSVSAVAEMLGYADIYTFSKAFKRYYGQSPSKYKDYINKCDSKYGENR